jgi:AcrR family transcriptional regulator
MATIGVEVSRRERKKDETRTRIFRAAVELFREKGFEATTVDEITERADVAKGTFFNYFPRKEAVLGYLSELQLAEVEAMAGEMLQARGPVREKLIELLQRTARVYEQDPELSRFVVQESMKRAHTPNDEFHIQWHRLLARLIRQGQEAGEFRRDAPEERAVSVLGSVYMGTVFMWLCCRKGAAAQADAGFALQDELAARIALVLDGLAV